MIRLVNILMFQLMFSSLIYSQWERIYTSSNNQWFGMVVFTNESSGFITRYDSSIIKTTNGGLNWFNLNGTSGYGLGYMQFTSSNTGYTIGNSYFDVAHVLKTTNAGQNWSVQTFNYYFTSCKFINDNTGYITSYGDTVNSLILKTTNGGINWSVMEIVNAYDLSSIDFVDSNIGFAIAEYGKFFKTTNAGNNWVLGYSPSFSWVDFVTPNLGFGVFDLTSGNRIYRTTDGGANWTIVHTVVDQFPYFPFFIDANTGWMVGYKKYLNNTIRLVLKTSNSGSNWFEQSSGLPSDSTSCISTVYMVNQNMGYFVTNPCMYPPVNPLNPSVFKTTNGGGDPIGIFNQNNEITGYALYQNYPNPFNPVTRLSFSIPVSGNVELKIYDVLGEELLTLLNEYRTAGTYNINFDATNLPSGCYFYKLISGDFEDSKKMVLIR